MLYKNQNIKSPGNLPKKIWPYDPHFKRVYNKIILKGKKTGGKEIN